MNKIGNEIIITEEESKICLLDGKKFDSNRKMIWYVKKNYNLNFESYIIKTYYNDIRPMCLKTGNSLSFKGRKLGPWFSNYSKNNFPRKPHSKESKQKIKDGCEKTSMEKFGVKNVFTTDWCKDKSKETLFKKYGVDNIMKLDEMKESFSHLKRTPESIIEAENTSITKFGVKHYSITSNHRLNIRKKGFYRFYKNWNGYLNDLKENKQDKIECLGSIQDIENDKPLKFKCKFCESIWEDPYISMPNCKKCDDNFENSRSVEESTLTRWVKSVLPSDISLKSNKRFNINDKIYEVDICIEDKKLIIELNGLYWHSEIGGHKDKFYHINKLKSLESIGYCVLQIFEDEWLFKTDIIKNKILHKLGINHSLPKIYARNCIIKNIDNVESNEFLDKTHIQGKSNASYCFGAYFENKLVSVMTFSSPRIHMGGKEKCDNIYEMVRFSTINTYRVIGIAGKLLSYFIKDKSPNKIISYADRRWSYKNNNVYEKTIFKFIKYTNPSYWYVKKYKREHRYNFRKQRLIEMGFDPNKTEREIMRELKYDRIWDCGHLKYEWQSILG